jgi:hypothetical protein
VEQELITLLMKHEHMYLSKLHFCYPSLLEEKYQTYLAKYQTYLAAKTATILVDGK